MNDLMTKSFLSYVELKKQAQRDEAVTGIDIESGDQFNPAEEQNLNLFFRQVDGIKTEIEEIADLLTDLQTLNEETKSAHNAKILRGLRDRMDSDMVSILRKANLVKRNLSGLDESNADNRLATAAYGAGTPVDRTRISVTHGLRVKLREVMNDFQGLREKVLVDHKEDMRRRFFTATGLQPSEEEMEKMVTGSLKLEAFGGKTEMESVMDLQKSLNKLHQVFLDMAALVETQGEKMEDIAENVAKAGRFVNGGTQSLYYAKQMKRKSKKWMYWVWAVVVIIAIVCIVAMSVS